MDGEFVPQSCLEACTQVFVGKLYVARNRWKFLGAEVGNVVWRLNFNDFGISVRVYVAKTLLLFRVTNVVPPALVYVADCC